ncbi:MAG: DUF1015 domain-containing protein [Propionibacteriaceae bacterium]|nr:DUF1015 domain-containing protein [Propionibacteriaceae bacterium]
MPDFRPFPALRYFPGTDLSAVLAPPYDVLSAHAVDRLHARHPHNITHVDVPEDHDYAQAGAMLALWVDQGVLVADTEDSFSIYRMSFVDETGASREIQGVLGGLEVVDYPVGPIDPMSANTRASTVLPHERTTDKASTDRLELMRATSCNTSPVWGLSLASGLTDALSEPGELLGSVETDGVTHRIERVSDPARVATIRQILASDDVLIADGHHRYGVSRIYRNDIREATGRTDTPAEQTLTFVGELIEDQLSIEAIHRLYSGVGAEDLRRGLAAFFDFSPVEEIGPDTLAAMVRLGRLVVVWPDGSAEWLSPKPGVFDDVRSLDGVWLETALSEVPVEVAYQHGLAETMECASSGDFTAAILIRPTSIDEIRRTAREGLLMPPKSTFFTPKLLTGWVVRPTEPLPGHEPIV